MVKVRLVKGNEFTDMQEQGYRVDYAEERGMRTMVHTTEAPFRDTESLNFLKRLGISFDPNEEYTVHSWGRTFNICCLDEDIFFALGVIELSRKGSYSWFKYLPEHIWASLSKVPFDILIAMRLSERGIHSDNIEGIDYKVINYPYQNGTIEVNVVDRLEHGDEYYTKLFGEKERGTNTGLLLGRDNQYYIQVFDIDFALQYWWFNDTDELLKKIDELEQSKEEVKEIVSLNETFTIFSLGKLLKGSENYLLPDKGNLSRLLSQNSTEEEKAKIIREDPDYAYYKNVFKVTMHLQKTKVIKSERLPILLVDRLCDGSYKIQEELTRRYPDLMCILYDLMDWRSNEISERVALVLDEKEPVNSTSDLEKAVYGFVVTQDSIDVYDADEGVELFGKALREARLSGRCVIDTRY